MFTVQAIDQAVSIASLSTFTDKETTGNIQVYTRVGHYMGHTAKEEDWTLIYDDTVQQRGPSSKTRLGPFIDNQRVNISRGQKQSFYVYATENLSYQYDATWTEGNAVIENDNLRLFAGVALAYGKWEEGCVPGRGLQGQCLFSPRVFSGSLEYSLPSAADASTTTSSTSITTTSTTSTSTTTTPETTTTTSSPLDEVVEFATPNQQSAQSSAKGVVFTVEAMQNIAIKGVDIITQRNADSEIYVYEYDGSYMGKPLQSDEWTLVHQQTILGRSNELVRLDDFEESIGVEAGGAKSFYVYNKKGLMYAPGSNEGLAYANDNSIVVHEGRVMKGFFRRVTSVSGQWAGAIRYGTADDL